jgi:hypothetical protein
VAAALERAALTAADRGAPDVAAELAELAAALTPLDRLLPGGEGGADAGAYLFRAGDTARARRHLERVVEEMPAGRDGRKLCWSSRRSFAMTLGEAVAILHARKGPGGRPPPAGSCRHRIHIEIARLCDSDLPYAARHAEAGLALAQLADDRAWPGKRWCASCT